MIFEDWELNIIKKALNDTDLMQCAIISNKIEQLQATSRNKRYTLRTTDWLSDSAKRQKGKKKKAVKGGDLI